MAAITKKNMATVIKLKNAVLADVVNDSNGAFVLAPLLQLLRFSSQSLPTGSFAWSQGLETAIESGWLNNAVELEDWLAALLDNNFRWQELPLLVRLLSVTDLDKFKYWNQYSIACRETAELYQEDIQSGRAILKLLVDTDIPEALSWSEQHDVEYPISYVAAYGIACRYYQIDYALAASGLIWSWLDNQIAAALKLFPLGQTDGQRVIGQLLSQVPALIQDAAKVKDDDLGMSLPGLVLSSMQHEIQYSRLFRS